MTQQGIIGDQTGVDLPQTQVDPDMLDEERKTAAFSKTKEYKKLKEHFDQRIKFYQACLPSGDSVAINKKSTAELGQDWKVANIVIGEFQQVINLYENAREAVDGRKDA